MKGMGIFNIKRKAALLAAAVMLTASAAVPASAETVTADTSAKYSIEGLSKPKITKAVKTTNSITLKWTKVKGATGYKIYKKTGSKYKAVGTVKGGSKVKFKVKKLKSGTKYSFKVRAYKKKSGKTSWSRYSGAYSVYTKGDRKAACAAYKEYLSQENIVWSESLPDVTYPTSDMQFRIDDLNDDGVPELMLRSERPSHAEGCVKWVTYSGGKIKSLVNDEGPSYYYPKAGVFGTWRMTQGYSTASYYKLSPSGDVKFVGSLTNDNANHPDGKGTETATWGEKRKGVSPAVFKKNLKKLTKGEKRKSPVNYKFVDNTSENRDSILK